MYTRTETIYYAEDGKEFKSISECRDYENNLLKNSTMECWDYQGVKIDDISESNINDIYVIKLNSEEDKTAFNILFENCDISCPEKLNTFYMWRGEYYGKFMTSQEYEECIEPSYFIIKKLEAEEK